MKALRMAAAMAAILAPMTAWADGAWDTEVTGKSQAQCMQANDSCEARLMGQLGLTMGPVEVGVQCTPYYAQCMINAAAAPAPAGMEAVTVMVVKDVDVYDAPGGTGTVIGMLTRHQEVIVMGPCVDNWCHVEGAGVPRNTGFVYSGPDFESLQFP
jgi:hypothetical protein